MSNCCICGQDRERGEVINGGFVCDRCVRVENAAWDRDPAYKPGQRKWHGYETDR
jgi:hypothetical protein